MFQLFIVVFITLCHTLSIAGILHRVLSCRYAFMASSSTAVIVRINERSKLCARRIDVRISEFEALGQRPLGHDFLSLGYHRGPFGAQHLIEDESWKWNQGWPPHTLAEGLGKLLVRDGLRRHSVENTRHPVLLDGKLEQTSDVFYVDPREILLTTSHWSTQAHVEG